MTGVGAAAVARASGKEGLKGDKNGGKHVADTQEKVISIIIQFQILVTLLTFSNRPVSSCVLGDLAFEWQQGWR